MATGPAKAVASDWQDVPASDWQEVPSAATPTGEEQKPGMIERFDKAFVEPQMAPPNESVGHHIVRGMSNFGGGVIGGVTAPFLHPVKTLAGIGGLITEPVEAVVHPGHDEVSQMAKSTQEHPEEAVESGLGNVVGGSVLGGAAEEGMMALPSKARAINTLNSVGNAARDVPMTMTETEPAVQNFRQYVKTGGRGSPVINKLVNRMAAEEPMNFPEARKFYTNVSRASARPGFLRRAIESPSAPDLRYNLGNVREAMGTDLTNAAESVGQGDKYTQGLREYANAAKLNRGMKIGGAIATEEALRRSGILGKMAAGAADMAR